VIIHYIIFYYKYYTGAYYSPQSFYHSAEVSTVPAIHISSVLTFISLTGYSRYSTDDIESFYHSAEDTLGIFPTCANTIPCSSGALTHPSSITVPLGTARYLTSLFRAREEQIARTRNSIQLTLSSPLPMLAPRPRIRTPTVPSPRSPALLR
jgi:hypothetical protein